MILVYAPIDGDEKSWDLDETKVTFAEAKAAEKAGGFQWREVSQELKDGHLGATQAALWVLRKRDEPNLRFADLEDLGVTEVRVEYGPAEKAFLRAAVAGNADLSDEEKRATLALLGADGDEDDDPKET